MKLFFILCCCVVYANCSSCSVNPNFRANNCTQTNLIVTSEFQLYQSYNLADYIKGSQYYQISLIANGISDHMTCEVVCDGSILSFACGTACDDWTSSNNVANLWLTSDITSFMVSSINGSCQLNSCCTSNILKITQIC